MDGVSAFVRNADARMCYVPPMTVDRRMGGLEGMGMMVQK